MEAIRFDQVSKRYPGGQDALTTLSFGVNGGEMVFITGHSGAGKSSLLRLVGALDRPTRGLVQVLGENLGRLSRRAVPRYRRRLGLVFQDHRLLMDRSVFHNVVLPLVVAGVAADESARRVRAALDKVGLLGSEGKRPLQLSGGERQRVGIARALVGKPELLLADEPTGNLDPNLSAEIMGLFASFAEAGTTVLVASHDLALVQRMQKRVLVLEKGKLIDDFRPRSRHER
ncbi:MAG: cell division ATP-binding protein FtsE [Xanthomonadales bacterium]|nr:cell division ATP-binding protein FtsE [Xanthomonadales bacterium]